MAGIRNKRGLFYCKNLVRCCIIGWYVLNAGVSFKRSFNVHKDTGYFRTVQNV